MDDLPQGENPAAAGGVLDALEHLPDRELQTVISRAISLLDEREKERKQEALREIERIAKEHGLQVAVKGPPRKRGRPRKPKG